MQRTVNFYANLPITAISISMMIVKNIAGLCAGLVLLRGQERC